MFRIKKFILNIFSNNEKIEKIVNHDIADENKNTKNLIENNNNELLRVSTENWLIDFVFGSSFKSPIENYINKNYIVLNSLCNYGTWTLNMSEKYPNSYFYGIDYDIEEKKKKLLIPKDIKFPNCNFYEWDIDNELNITFIPEKFDFIYQRLFFHRIKKNQWDNIFTNLKNKCKSGGWIEMVEMDTYAYNAGPLFEKFNRLAIKVTEDIGIMPRLAYDLKKEFEKVGLINVSEIRERVYIFNNNDKLSNIFKDNIKDIFINCKPFLSKEMKIDNYEEYLNEMIEECNEYKTYYNYYCVYGMKT